MKTCHACHVKIRGQKDACPLCGLPLTPTPPTEPPPNAGHADYFPYVPPRVEGSLALKWLIFASVAVILAMIPLRIYLPERFRTLPRLIVLGVLSMWLVVLTVIRKRHNISKSIVWQFTVLSFLAIIWDRLTGWRGWSLDYAIPVIIIGAQLALFISSRVLRVEPGDYIVYFGLAGLFGLVPAIFLLAGWIHVKLLSLIALIVSLLFLTFILLFRRRVLAGELSKRMHL